MEFTTKRIKDDDGTEKIYVYDENGNQITRSFIRIDDDGKEYYYISNPYDTLGLFTNKPKDAIECIRNGLGDTFQRTKMLNMEYEKVIRFVDREYGEELRQKTIDGWKDAKFAYAVKFIYMNSFSSGNFISKDKTLMGMSDNNEDILTFETESEAMTFIEEVNNKAKEYHEEYLSIERTGDHDFDYDELFKPLFDKIKGNGKEAMDSVYWRAFSGINTKVKEGKERPEYKMKVVQIVLP